MWKYTHLTHTPDQRTQDFFKEMKTKIPVFLIVCLKAIPKMPIRSALNTFVWWIIYFFIYIVSIIFFPFFCLCPELWGTLLNLFWYEEYKWNHVYPFPSLWQYNLLLQYIYLFFLVLYYQWF